MADRVVLARVPAGQPLDLLAALCGLFGAAVPGGLMSAGDGYGNAAELVAPDGVTTRQLVRTLERATAKLNDGQPAPHEEPVEHDDDPDDGLRLNAMRASETGVEFGIGGAPDEAAEFAKGVLAAFIPAFEAHPGAINYLSWDAVDPDTGGRYSLIVVKPEGLTPHEARQRAEAETERLRALLAEHGIEDPVSDQTRVTSHPLWCTRPGWTRAHVVTLGATLGAEQHFVTACGRDYPLDDPETDEPAAAPVDMPRCTHCTDVLEGRRT